MSANLDYEINKELGECYLFMGDLDKAEEYYLKAAGSNGVHPDPYLGLATIAVQRGDLDKAMGLYKQAADIEANDKSLAGMALVEMETGAQESAYDHFSRALELNPENMVAVFGIIQAGHALNRIEQIIPRLADCLELNPLKHDIRYSLAGCLSSMGRNEDALSELERILEQEPDHAPANELYKMLRP